MFQANKKKVMKHIALSIFLLFALLSGYGQEGRMPKGKTLRITKIDSAKKSTYGYLVAISDSDMVVMKSPVQFNQRFLDSNQNTTSYKNLSTVHIQRKGSLGRGMWIGALSGLAVGVLGAALDNASEDGLTPAFVILITAQGFVIGALVGALWKKRFKINGNKEKFARMKKTVLDMTYGY